ncbi:MAG: lysophospholipid acyltransferase family protein [Acholeplasmataceae bacterium]|jgi:1-acyl-sn-glycerol-3-phosphate acyltransferase|nr:lysophospholipid acyltransferase family protein [Acholeplasmataceae bacterium]
MKRPHPFLYITLGFLLKIFSIIKGQKIIEKTTIQGPAILLSNHTSFYDFIYTTSAIYPKRITYLAASKMFYETATKPFLKLARAVPKSLMQADPVASLKAFRILKKNGIVSVFPEGQISPSGKTLKPSFSIAKFLKKAAADVYIVKHYGAGMVNPPWTKKTFKGLIETRIYKLLTKEEILTLSLEAIYDQVYQHLQFSPSSYLSQSPKIYKHNSIKGLENVIYQCPVCLYEGLESSKHHLSCPSCHHEMTYDNGLLDHKGIDVWFEEQEKRLREKIDQQKDFELKGNAELMSFRKNKLVPVGEGELHLKDDMYTYQGTVDGENKTLKFYVKSTPTLPSDIGRNVQIYEGYQIYQFELKIPWLPTKFVHASEYLYEKSQKNG